ncbi:MAG: GxxExxY protein [Terriglobales bacterium]
MKAARAIEPVFESPVLNYLRATTFEIGLLLNFGSRPEIRRLAFSNDRKRISVHQR